jgi:hypothetical protein
VESLLNSNGMQGMVWAHLVCCEAFYPKKLLHINGNGLRGREIIINYGRIISNKKTFIASF